MLGSDNWKFVTDVPWRYISPTFKHQLTCWPEMSVTNCELLLCNISQDYPQVLWNSSKKKLHHGFFIWTRKFKFWIVKDFVNNSLYFEWKTFVNTHPNSWTSNIVKQSAGICWGSQINTLKEIKSKGEFQSLDKNRIKEYNYFFSREHPVVLQ